MHSLRLGFDLPPGVQVLMKVPAGRNLVDQLKTPDLDDPVALARIQPRGFGVQDDFTERGPIILRSGTNFTTI